MTAVAVILLAAGTFFLGVSALGVLRFPDFYSRAHVVGKSETLGIMLVVAGLIAHEGPGPATLRLVFVLVFAMIANPTAIHALARAAHRTGVRPWTRSRT
jgi:multicomponent Na+:H+ antiporter subunit G